MVCIWIRPRTADQPYLSQLQNPPLTAQQLSRILNYIFMIDFEGHENCVVTMATCPNYDITSMAYWDGEELRKVTV